MTVYERVVRCRLIEKMEEYPDYSERLGLEDESRLEGMVLEDVSGLIEMGLKNIDPTSERRRATYEES